MRVMLLEKCQRLIVMIRKSRQIRFLKNSFKLRKSLQYLYSLRVAINRRSQLSNNMQTKRRNKRQLHSANCRDCLTSKKLKASKLMNTNQHQELLGETRQMSAL